MSVSVWMGYSLDMCVCPCVRVGVRMLYVCVCVGVMGVGWGGGGWGGLTLLERGCTETFNSKNTPNRHLAHPICSIIIGLYC